MGVDSNYASNVPAFLTKLWTLVEDPDTNHLICWSAVSQNSDHSLTLRELSRGLESGVDVLVPLNV